MKKTKELKARIKRIKNDKRRMLRVVEYFDFSGIIEGSPVQVQEGYIVSDIATNEIFASFTFQNLSKNSVVSLSVRLLLYQNSNLPYIKIPFVYSEDEFTLGVRERPGKVKMPFYARLFKRDGIAGDIETYESFGRASYIKIPEAYFRKAALEIVNVVYAGGKEQKIGVIVANKCKRISELDDEKKYAFSKVNIYSGAEEFHPSRVIPVVTQEVWLCCCGNKNILADTKCRVCERDRDWLLQNINETKLEETVKVLKRESDPHLRDKAGFNNSRREETDKEIEEKIKSYEKVIQRLAEEERIKQRKNKMIVPKILLYFGVLYLIVYLLQLFFS